MRTGKLKECLIEGREVFEMRKPRLNGSDCSESKLGLSGFLSYYTTLIVKQMGF